MGEDKGLTRLLTSAEADLVRKVWLRPLRRMSWIFGGSALLCGSCALLGRPRVLLLVTVIFGLFFFVFFSRLRQMSTDLDAGLVKQIAGSVVKGEGRVVGIGLIAVLFRVQFIFDLWRLSRYPGHPAALVGPEGRGRFDIDLDTLYSLRDGELVKAEVLPGSRAAVRVRHKKLGGD